MGDTSLRTAPTSWALLRVRGGRGAFALLSVVLFCAWLVLSDKWDVFHIALGAASAPLAAWLSLGVTFVGMRKDRRGREVARFVFSFHWARFPVHLLRLAVAITVANLRVIRVILDPRLPIAPRFVRVRAGFDSDTARAWLANATTLTPGTVTVDVCGDEMLVHALTEADANGVLDGTMRAEVLATFDLGDRAATGT